MGLSTYAAVCVAQKRNAARHGSCVWPGAMVTAVGRTSVEH